MNPFPRTFARLLVAVTLLAGAIVPAATAAAPVPPSDFAPNRLLIKFTADAPPEARDQALNALGGQVLHEYSLVPGLTLVGITASSEGVPQTVAAASEQPFVEYAEPDYIVQPVVIPNDPDYGSLYGMTKIDAPAAWDVSTGDPNLVVAVIDTGTDYNHPDLNDNIWINTAEQNGVAGVDDDGNGYIDDVHGWDFFDNENNPADPNGHGTHTAGTICAEGDNGTGVVGVVWRCKIMPLRFLGPNGGSISDAIEALNYAVAKGVKVSNNSWGGGGYSTSLYNAINNAKLVGHIFVAAAGNAGRNNDTSPFYPASYSLDNVISVAATDSNDNRASFSNYGASSVDLGAPGVSIRSTIPNNSYSSYNGTSMAAPHVAGVVALVYGVNPGWSYLQVRQRIFSTVRPVASMMGVTATGGIVNAAAAVSGGAPPTATNTPVPTATNTPVPTATNTPVTTATNTPATPAPTNTPVPSGTLHVGDLDGEGSIANSTSWRARVTILVHSSAHGVLRNALVSGYWSDGATGAASCTTNIIGSCILTKNNLSRSTVASVKFNVQNVSLAGYTYTPISEDPDGDSNGVTIQINRPN